MRGDLANVDSLGLLKCFEIDRKNLFLEQRWTTSAVNVICENVTMGAILKRGRRTVYINYVQQTARRKHKIFFAKTIALPCLLESRMLVHQLNRGSFRFVFIGGAHSRPEACVAQLREQRFDLVAVETTLSDRVYWEVQPEIAYARRLYADVERIDAASSWCAAGQGRIVPEDRSSPSPEAGTLDRSSASTREVLVSQLAGFPGVDAPAHWESSNAPVPPLHNQGRFYCIDREAAATHRRLRERVPPMQMLQSRRFRRGWWEQDNSNSEEDQGGGRGRTSLLDEVRRWREDMLQTLPDAFDVLQTEREELMTYNILLALDDFLAKKRYWTDREGSTSAAPVSDPPAARGSSVAATRSVINLLRSRRDTEIAMLTAAAGSGPAPKPKPIGDDSTVTIGILCGASHVDGIARNLDSHWATGVHPLLLRNLAASGLGFRMCADADFLERRRDLSARGGPSAHVFVSSVLFGMLLASLYVPIKCDLWLFERKMQRLAAETDDVA